MVKTASKKRKSKDPFILHVEKEMDWNKAKVTELVKNVLTINMVKWDSDLLKDDWTRAFNYKCLAGSSVKSAIRSVVNKYFKQHELNFNFTVVADLSNNRGDIYHEYTIIFLK